LDKDLGCAVFNIANEDERTIEELAQEIKVITGSESEIRLVDAPPRRYDCEVDAVLAAQTSFFEP